MRALEFVHVVAVLVFLIAWTAVPAQDLPKPAVPPEGRTRGLADIVGFATKAEQMDVVVPHCEKMSAPHLAELEKSQGVTPDTRWIAAICPHDDYIYAGPVYVDALTNVKAKIVVLFGVCHKARAFGLRDKLVFDSFEHWRGPYGPISISPLREEIERRLPKEDWLVSDDAQGSEWSVEGIVPWLQHKNRDLVIVPILVPHMAWPRTQALARDLAKALSGVIADEKLKVGEDIAFVMSCDGSHYGDQPDGWDYAPFGCGADGFLKAQAQDEILVRSYLNGPLDLSKAQGLAEALVDQTDVTKYKVTWCGRFSVTLGLATLHFLTADLGMKPLEGVSTGYGTSVGGGLLPFEKLGLGTTAPANLHHWVSYVAEGYR